jgi:hypothetical protein
MSATLSRIWESEIKTIFDCLLFSEACKFPNKVVSDSIHFLTKHGKVSYRSRGWDTMGESLIAAVRTITTFNNIWDQLYGVGKFTWCGRRFSEYWWQTYRRRILTDWKITRNSVIMSAIGVSTHEGISAAGIEILAASHTTSGYSTAFS